MNAASVTPFQEGSVRGFLHHPEAAARDGLVLSHGAGSDCNAPLLLVVADALTAAGLAVLRIDLPFRQHHAHGPLRFDAQDREGIREAASVMRRLVPGRVFLGGHSYGGRQSSRVAAADPGLAQGLLLLSFPLHPSLPRNPERYGSRTDHFPTLRVPVLFVHGTRDPMASIEEIQSALQLIPPPARLVEVAGARHDLNRGRFDIEWLVVEPFLELTGRKS